MPANTSTEKLIEYILSLPKKEQQIISRRLQKHENAKANYKKQIKKFIKHAKTTSGRLPKDFKFDREEANER